MGLFFGYDPGGDGANAVAKINVDDATGEATSVEVETTRTAADALAYLSGTVESPGARGLGVDTLTEWSLGSAGWRPADLWLRRTYPAAAPSVVSPNSIFGAMCLNGMGVLHELRSRASELTITETHPKVQYFALTGQRYSWKDRADAMIGWLRELLKHPALRIRSDDEFDAVLSAWACSRGVLHVWSRDLHTLAEQKPWAGIMVRPVGTTNYFWPP